MTRSELLARTAVFSVIAVAIALPLWLWWRTPLVHARMSQEGGWDPGTLVAQVGVPLKLRLTSDDVVHGFAVGHLDFPDADIYPGKVTDVTLLFREPGTYTFYCTRWCGLDHWRMRGTIEVADSASPSPSLPQPDQPLFASLGLDLDAQRSAPAVPAERPVAALATDQFQEQLARYSSVDYYRRHSPYEAWTHLRRDPGLSALDDQQIWGLTASIWKLSTSPAALADGKQLFARNCAACHGERGSGDGVFADDLRSASAQDTPGTAISMLQAPADLTDAPRMLAASPALLQGKILRGGMGTGMPSWGTILTPDQTWNLVAYLYSFQFSDQ